MKKKAIFGTLVLGRVLANTNLYEYYITTPYKIKY